MKYSLSIWDNTTQYGDARNPSILIAKMKINVIAPCNDESRYIKRIYDALSKEFVCGRDITIDCCKITTIAETFPPIVELG